VYLVLLLSFQSGVIRNALATINLRKVGIENVCNLHHYHHKEVAMSGKAKQL
jgi:hypothetical protein